MARIVPVVLLVALVVYAFIDCVRTPEDSMPVGIPKVLWAALILVFPGLGALAWLAVSRFARGGRTSPPSPGRGPGRPSPRGPRGPRGPVAPDDDPEFLARLETERRRRERERRAKEAADPAGGPVTDDGRPPRSPDEVSPDDAPHSPDEAAHGGAEPHPGRDVEDGDAGAQPPRQA
ncbi:PLD nuclease N-terminal domain-containing protein [Georgenia sp. M64]|uniref:PLD nuclease N-terminal domain-containing protein n=1 Tax=Georgenia sp. M64 TaxID=3120520 RepID=UPI0030E5A82A